MKNRLILALFIIIAVLASTNTYAAFAVKNTASKATYLSRRDLRNELKQLVHFNIRLFPRPQHYPGAANEKSGMPTLLSLVLLTVGIFYAFSFGTLISITGVWFCIGLDAAALVLAYIGAQKAGSSAAWPLQFW